MLVISTTSASRTTPCGSVGPAHEAKALAEPETLVQRQARAAVGLLAVGHRPVVLEPGVRHARAASRSATRSIVWTSLSGSMRPDRDDGLRPRRRHGLPAADAARCRARGSSPGRCRALPPSRRWRRVTGETTSAPGVGGARQPAGEPRRRRSGCPATIAAARRRQVGLAHVDAVLGEHHRRAVQRLVHERRHRGPARGGDVQDVGRRASARPRCARPSRASGRAPRPRPGRASGACPPRGSRSASTSRRRRGTPPSRARAEDAAARRAGWRRHHDQGLDDGLACRRPSRQVAHERRGQLAARRAGRSGAGARPRGSSSDHTSMRPTCAGVRRELEERPAGRAGATIGRTCQSNSVRLAHEQVAPRADAAHRRRGRCPPWSAARALRRRRRAGVALAGGATTPPATGRSRTGTPTS